MYPKFQTTNCTSFSFCTKPKIGGINPLVNTQTATVREANLMMILLPKLKWCLLQKGYQHYCAFHTAVPVCLNPDIAQ